MLAHPALSTALKRCGAAVFYRCSFLRHHYHDEQRAQPNDGEHHHQLRRARRRRVIITFNGHRARFTFIRARALVEITSAHLCARAMRVHVQINLPVSLRSARRHVRFDCVCGFTSNMRAHLRDMTGPSCFFAAVDTRTSSTLSLC